MELIDYILVDVVMLHFIASLFECIIEVQSRLYKVTLILGILGAFIEVWTISNIILEMVFTS